MNERAVQFWVGTVIVATGLIACILVLYVGNKPSMFQPTYTLHLEFKNAPGVSDNTPIRRSGILIGRVKKVELTPKGMVDVTAGIYKTQKIPTNAQCEIRTGMLGDSEIEFSIPSTGPSPKHRAEGDTIQGSRATDPISAMANLEKNLSGAIEAVSSASQDLGKTLKSIDGLINRNQQHIDSIAERTDNTLKLINETTKFTHDLMSNETFRQELKGEIEQIPNTLAQARTAIGKLNTTMDKMGNTLNQVDVNLNNISNITTPLGEKGESIAYNIDKSLQRLNELMFALETFGKSINNRDGTLGRLTQDDEIYERLNRTVRNIEEISYRLKPIVNDARIISDKIARHPGIILRDAIRPGSGTKGLPPMNWDPANCAKQPSCANQPSSSWTR